MNDDQRRARQHERVIELGGGTIRAISGQPDLYFRGLRLYRGRNPVDGFAAHLQPQHPIDDLAAFRGIADGLALRLTRSDASLHRQLQPETVLERLLFDLLEQYRAESLSPASMPGMRHNLRRRHEDWALAYHHEGHTDSARGLLLYAVTQICRARIFGEPVIEETEDMLEATRAALAPRLGHAFAQLRALRHDQAAFAAPAREVARAIADLLQEDDGAAPDGQDSDDIERRSVFSLITPMEAQAGEEQAAAHAGRSPILTADAGQYRVFTDAWDVELAAGSLARPAQLAELRERLDLQIRSRGINLARLARALQTLLADPVREGWDDAQEEGRIDGRRIANLIASPTERRLFRTERDDRLADCVLTMLIDCSGSMRRYAPAVAATVDVLARALEQAGVDSEILGFTTAAWNGGRAARDWRRAGQPPRPGRLNERCHLVFKAAQTSWRRARQPIAALLKDDLFREGLDGEAVDWACQRLLAQSRRRRILLVFSDGSPMDSATHQANDAHYLDHHLQDVVARHERDGRIEIAAVGVGLDLSAYYRRSHVLDFATLTGQGVLREILELLAGRHRR